MLRFIILMVITCCSCLPAGKEIGRQKRVLSGTALNNGQHPFLVTLWYYGDRGYRYQNVTAKHFCGGALINKQWLLTAAHCISGAVSDMKKWKAFVNVYNQSNVCDIDGYEIILNQHHPSYFKPSAYSNDIALLKLAKPVQSVTPGIANKDTNCPASGRTVNVIGWGETETSLVSELPMISPPLNVVNSQVCNKSYNQPEVLKAFNTSKLNVDDTALCAGVPQGGQNSCYGSNW